MQILQFQQGTPEWAAHRHTALNASDAPVMLGISPYRTRSALLHERATGIVDAEIDPAVLRIFAEGHRAEALARPLAEKIIGEELYPMVGTDGRYSASFDGLTLLEDTCFEHKSLNESLRYPHWDEANGDHLPDHYRAQMEQQCMVSGCERILFMASSWTDDGTLIEERHCWYMPDPAMRARIVAGWAQFEKDVAAYVLPGATPVIVAEAAQALPAVSVQISGQIDVRENFNVFEVALRDFLDNKLIREPETDQDFANLDQQIKAMKKAEEMLNAAETMMLAQIQSVDEAKRQKDMLAKLVRDNRLMAEKLLDSEKTRRRAEKVEAARKAFAAHVATLQSEISDVRLEIPVPDFAGAIKGLKTLVSIQDKIDTALANGKIAADQQAADLRTKLGWIDANAAEHRALLADMQQLVAKPFDDFTLAITARVEAHKKAEEARLEADRARIRAEEAARLEREHLIRAEQEAQASIAEASAADALPAPLLDDMSKLAADARVEAVAEIDANTAINAAQRSAAAPTLRLGQINERLAPIAMTADGLASLGFPHAATDKAAKLYHEHDFPRICAALVQHIHTAVQAAAHTSQPAACGHH